MNKKKGIIIAAAAAVVLVAVILLLVLVPKGGSDGKTATLDEGVALERSVDADGMHQAVVLTDKNGNIENNSYGTLMEYYPANIKSIHIENAGGSFDVESDTPEGQATVYTLKGYEDFDLQSGNPDLIASAAASLSFSKVATLDKNKAAEFGFDKPRSTVTVYYEDDTKAVIIVGNDAPQQAGTYIKFGTGDAVYVAETDVVSAFDFSVNDLISLRINENADSTDNNELTSLTLSGAAFDKPLTLVPSENTNYSASYQMTEPVSRLANESESSLIAGGIRGLYATSVKMVNPSGEQLAQLGLDKPYAAVSADYPDATIELIAGKPDGDGNVNVMVKGEKVVYTIAAEKVAWCQTSYEKLCGEYVCNPKMTELSGMTVKANGKTYEFKLSSRESVTTDDKGVETSATVTTVTYGGKEIEIGKFSSFYNDIALIGLADAKTENGGSTALSVTYTFADGSSDTAEFLATGDKYVAKLNGEIAGHCNKGDITRAVNGVAEVIK